VIESEVGAAEVGAAEEMGAEEESDTGIEEDTDRSEGSMVEVPDVVGG
jgi:hypothetical protein